MRFEDFVLQLDPGSRGGFRARVLRSPAGEGSVEFSLPWLAGEKPAPHDESGTSRDIAYQGAAAPFQGQQPVAIGSELFRSVFQGQVRTLLDKSLGQLEASQDLGLRLKIKFDLSDKQARALADLPWELLCDGEPEDFIALSRQISLVRYLDVQLPPRFIPFKAPLRILAAAASPHGLQQLDLEAEAQSLEDLKRSSSGIEVQFLRHASIGAIREALAGDTYHVLHFMGHGTFDRVSGEGGLVFEGSGGSQEPVSGKALATKLKGLRSLGVVVVNACNTARACYQESANPFRGVATALVLGGVPAVVAMQHPISDRSAVAFSTAFYRHLARSDLIDEALTEGRQAIHSVSRETFEWATPALFLRIPEGNVFVPHPLSLKWFAPLSIIAALIFWISIDYPLDLRHWMTGDSPVSSTESNSYPAGGALADTGDTTAAPLPQPSVGNKVRLVIRFPEENQIIRLRGQDAIEVRGEVSGLPTSRVRNTARSVFLVIQDPHGRSLGSDRSPVTEEMTWRIALKPALHQRETNVLIVVYLEGSNRQRLAQEVHRITLIKEE